MPLKTQIIRSGKSVPLRWGDFHIAAMVLASSFDAETFIPHPWDVYEKFQEPEYWECYPDAPFPIHRNISWDLSNYPVIWKSPLGNTEYVLTRRHAFRDLDDGEILKLYPGDILMAWREFR